MRACVRASVLACVRVRVCVCMLMCGMSGCMLDSVRVVCINFVI